MKLSTSKIILVLGYPCAGKSTLAKNLATALEGTHISIGDLIREKREKDEQNFKRIDEAFKGQAHYPTEWIAEALQTRLLKNNNDNFIIIDGGPPLDQVFELLALEAFCVFYIEVKDDSRLQRFNKRTKTGQRTDDEIYLFQNRSLFYKKNLGSVLHNFKKKTAVYEIEGETNEMDVLRQALSCSILSPSLNYSKISLIKIDENQQAEGIVSVIKRLKNISKANPHMPVKWELKTKAFDSKIINNLVLLLKPSIEYRDGFFQYIDRTLLKHGYLIKGVSVWQNEAIAATQAIEAHLDLHYLVARWGNFFLSNDSFRVSGKHLFINAYEFVRQNGVEQLERIWSNANEERPKLIKRCVWAATRMDKIILNGHIPSIINQYKHNGNEVICLHIQQASHTAKDWKWLRNSFLGCSDPSKAISGSLRRLAYENSLDISGDVSFSNNAFHLSAGPLEAFRELIIWFGAEVGQSAFKNLLSITKHAFDRPLEFMYDTSKSTSSYDATENLNASELIELKEFKQ